MAGEELPRRDFLKTAGLGTAAALTGSVPLAAPAEALIAMESGKAQFNAGFTSAFFFDNFLQLTMEGFFADPIYGGNKDKVAWKMIGFPGLPASYRDEIRTYFNRKYDKGPLSIAD